MTGLVFIAAFTMVLNVVSGVFDMLIRGGGGRGLRAGGQRRALNGIDLARFPEVSLASGNFATRSTSTHYILYASH